MSNNSNRWAGAALVAGMAGYVAGVLTAPKSGKETRQDIKVAAAKAKSQAEKKLKIYHSELVVLLEQAKSVGGDMSGKAKDGFGKAVDNAQVAKEKIRDILSAIHEGGADDPELDAALKQAKEAKENLLRYIQKKA